MVKNTGSTQRHGMKILSFLNWPFELCPIVFSGWREFLVGTELSPVR